MAWGAGIILCVPILMLIAANTSPGQREIAALISQATDGQVTITNIGGRFPDRIRVGGLEVNDKDGTWLSLTNASLDWSPLRLLQRTAAVQQHAAQEIHLARLPKASTTSHPTTSESSFELPVRVELQQLKIARLVLDAPVAGTMATLSIAGSAELASLEKGTATIDVQRLDGAGSYHLQGSIDPARIEAALIALERRLESGEIDEAAFEAEEAELLDELAEIRRLRAETEQ